MSALPLLLLGSAAALAHAYSLSDAGGLGARYLGIGGLSGGGATSRLLPDYPDAIRSEIFDWLFKPSFGASLQILKVEVGGGGQSTEGTEASHQYTANASEASFQRGYEWLVMREALARDPNMSSWAWPAWVGCPGGDLTSPACDKGTPYTFPEQTAAYTTAFVQGAAREHNITISTVGSWNERGYSKDYILALRAALTGAGFTDTKIVCDDFNWKCGTDMLADPALLAAVDYVSGHNDQPPAIAQLKGARPTGDSEGYHTTGSDAGAASWIRELNTRYIEFNQSANIAWNLVTAYYEGTAFWPHGLMHAFQPWAGWYTVPASIWATAHYTQFTSLAQPWRYATVGEGGGSGYLAAGGSYVALMDDASGHWSLVLEKMPGDGSASAPVAAENATFALAGRFASPDRPTAALWSTLLGVTPGLASDPAAQFVRVGEVDLRSGAVTLAIVPGQILTLTTLLGAGSKGSHAPPPPPAAFPNPYADDFDACPLFQQPKYLTDFNGVTECIDSGDPAHGIVLQQMLPAAPIRWWADTKPHSVIGDVSWEDAEVSLQARCAALPGSAMVGVRASLAGRDGPDGIHAEDELPGLWLHVQCGAYPNATWGLAASAAQAGVAPFASGVLPPPGLLPGAWFTLRLQAAGALGSAWVGGSAVAARVPLPPAVPAAGWAALGALDWGHATQYDSLRLNASSARCSAAGGIGAPVAVQRCNAASPGQAFAWGSAGSAGRTLRLPGAAGDAPACLAVSPARNQYGSQTVVLAACNASRPEQQWALGGGGSLQTPGLQQGASVCLDVTADSYVAGQQLDVYGCQGSANQRWEFEGGLLSSGDPRGFFCAGACL